MKDTDEVEQARAAYHAAVGQAHDVYLAAIEQDASNVGMIKAKHAYNAAVRRAWALYDAAARQAQDARDIALQQAWIEASAELECDAVLEQAPDAREALDEQEEAGEIPARDGAADAALEALSSVPEAGAWRGPWIIRWRDAGVTLDRLARVLGISRERVRQLELAQRERNSK